MEIEYESQPPAGGERPAGAQGQPERAEDAADPAEPMAKQADDPVATGDRRVDAALRHLGALGNLPVSEHPPIFERVHGQLVEVLGELRADHDSLAHGQTAD
jgi:hypothetical protein